MKGLTLWQPWASLVACGAKAWETRGWGTRYRGPLLVHAAQRRPPRSSYAGGQPVELPAIVTEAMIEVLGIGDFDTLPRGCVLAIADLVDCVRIEDERDMHECICRAHGLGMGAARHEYLFGDWTPGRFAWALARVRLVEPLEARGAQGLWNAGPALEAAVAERIRG